MFWEKTRDKGLWRVCRELHISSQVWLRLVVGLHAAVAASDLWERIG